MTKIEAYRILSKMWNDATPEQHEAINIAMDAIEFVDLMPGDMVAVCRCKDCRHFYRDTAGDCSCELPRGLVTPTDDGFCFYGERGE